MHKFQCTNFKGLHGSFEKDQKNKTDVGLCHKTVTQNYKTMLVPVHKELFHTAYELCLSLHKRIDLLIY